MSRTVATGVQDFEKLIKENYFYIDKTLSIKEWWESGTDVTQITRPHRFGKTLNMNMINRFFSNKYKGKGAVFEGLSIWEDSKYRVKVKRPLPFINCVIFYIGIMAKR